MVMEWLLMQRHRCGLVWVGKRLECKGSRIPVGGGHSFSYEFWNEIKKNEVLNEKVWELMNMLYDHVLHCPYHHWIWQYHCGKCGTFAMSKYIITHRPIWVRNGCPFSGVNFKSIRLKNKKSVRLKTNKKSVRESKIFSSYICRR